MSEKRLQVNVVDRDAVLWAGNASYVSVPAPDGRMGILPGRQPMLAILAPGIIEVTLEDGQKTAVDADGGFVSVDSDVVTVVVGEGVINDPTK